MDSSSISPVKHTAGGEMPNVTSASSIGRRLRSALPVASNEVSIKSVILPFALIGLGVGAFFAFRSWRSGSKSEEQSSTSINSVEEVQA